MLTASRNKLDQNAIANARLNGLEKDVGLVGSQCTYYSN